MPRSRKRKKKVIKKKRHANNNGVPPDVDRKLRRKVEQQGSVYTNAIKHKHLVSELILDFLGDEKYYCHTTEDANRVAELGITCWNIALLDEEDREKQIVDLMEKFNNDPRIEVTFRKLIDRKKEHFDEYKYLIASHEVTLMPSGQMHLSVASANLDSPIITPQKPV